MRQIIFDTETTGMNKGAPYSGDFTVATNHRIIEIGCVELIDRQPTNNYFHCYLQPDREVDPEAIKVHGIDNAQLANEPRFKDIITDFWAYLDGADELIAHNMRFDQCFFDEELRLLGESDALADRFTLIDTLDIARKRHPGQKNNLDILCKRYNVDNTNRSLHGALLDAQLLAEVYLRLTGGQSTLLLDMDNDTSPPPIYPAAHETKSEANITSFHQYQWLYIKASEEERIANQRIMDEIRK